MIGVIIHCVREVIWIVTEVLALHALFYSARVSLETRIMSRIPIGFLSLMRTVLMEAKHIRINTGIFLVASTSSVCKTMITIAFIVVIGFFTWAMALVAPSTF